MEERLGYLNYLGDALSPTDQNDLTSVDYLIVICSNKERLRKPDLQLPPPIFLPVSLQGGPIPAKIVFKKFSEALLA